MKNCFRHFLTVLLVVGLAGCSRDTTAQATPKSPTALAETGAAHVPPKSHSLTIYGYNYTDRYIDDYRVNGQGGGISTSAQRLLVVAAGLAARAGWKAPSCLRKLR